MAKSSLVFDRCYGAMETVSPWAIPDGFAVSAINVDLSPHGLMRPRCGTSTISLTSGPSATINNMASIRSGASSEHLWAFSSFTSTGVAHRWNGSSWSSITLSDSPGPSGTNDYCVAVSYNNKVFLGYDGGSVNRLHCYDAGATTPAVRRVGLTAPAAPSIADQGAGAYAATLRYYKVQMLIHRDPSDASSAVHAQSELSSATSFTPSGGGASARVSKPTTVDSATHWRIYGSTDNITFYQITGDLAVATTTYDDNVAPANYYAFSGVTAPEPGLFVPPPSCLYLATNGERLFMAGAFESTAAATETTPSTRRVWFTRPIGATDGGDDESITQTIDSRYWVDIDNEDGSRITGLISALDGSVYAGTATSLWRLTDTGNTDDPIRAERVVAGAGPISQYCLTQTDTASGSMIYFAAADGPYRYSPSSGVQYLGADWVVRSAATSSTSYPLMLSCTFDPETRKLYWLYSSETVDDSYVRVLDPTLLQEVGGVLRGGWSLNEYQYGSNKITCAAVYRGKVYFGGEGPTIFTHDTSVNTDNGGTAYAVTLATREVIPGDGTGMFRVDEPFIYKRRDQAISITSARNRGGDGNTVSDTAPSEAIGGGETSWHRQKVEGLYGADAYSVSITLATSSPVITSDARHTDGVDRIVVPIGTQEAG